MTVSTPSRPLGLAIFGAGVVGGGVVELLKGFSDQYTVKYLIVKSIKKPRDFEIDHTTTVVSEDPQVALSDPSVDVYCEVVGGTEIGKLVFDAAVRNGKHYVTANKSFLAENLSYVESQASKTNKAFFFEAAVCGGIPVIGILRRGLCCDEITEIRGIVNGSTNYLLDRMTRENIDYCTALPDAQRLGFLEADPSADVLGYDARHKLVLLARLAFGAQIAVHQIPTAGITAITAADLRVAATMGRTFKLIASAKKSEGITTFVWPCLVPKTIPLADISHSGNAVEITGTSVGKQFLTGAGAGRFPTANSVVADLLEISRNPQNQYNTNSFARPLNTGISANSNISARLYIRSASRPANVVVDEIEPGIYLTKDAVPLEQVRQDLPTAFVALVL